jgi:hypothetical protein
MPADSNRAHCPFLGATRSHCFGAHQLQGTKAGLAAGSNQSKGNPRHRQYTCDDQGKRFWGDAVGIEVWLSVAAASVDWDWADWDDCSTVVAGQDTSYCLPSARGMAGISKSCCLGYSTFAELHQLASSKPTGSVLAPRRGWQTKMPIHVADIVLPSSPPNQIRRR